MLPLVIKSQMTGVVLAGGQAVRMAGQDKGLLPLQGKFMVEHVLERLRPQVGNVLVSANRYAAVYAALGECEVVGDGWGEYAGPLAGMAACLAVARTDYVLFCPCDAPLLCGDFVERMWAGLQESGAAGCVATDGVQWQPVFALLRRDLLPALEGYLARGDRKVALWYAEMGFCSVSFADVPDLFLNVNTPADHAVVSKRLAQSLIAVPLLGFAAFSGVGKTTLLVRVLPILRGRGCRVGVIKHGHKGFEVDREGKDSYRIRKEGGVEELVLASSERLVLMRDFAAGHEPSLSELLGYFSLEGVDLVLVEGFKHYVFPKIELHRPSLGKPLLFPEDKSIVAVACDAPLSVVTDLPLLDLNMPDVIADFILREFVR